MAVLAAPKNQAPELTEALSAAAVAGSSRTAPVKAVRYTGMVLSTPRTFPWMLVR